MDKSPALENFMNKMAVMQGKGQPKMSATTMKIGSGGLEKRIANNERKITAIKNIFKSQKINIGEKLSPSKITIETLQEQVNENNKLLIKLGDAMSLDYNDRLKEEKRKTKVEREKLLAKKRRDKESAIEARKKFTKLIGTTLSGAASPFKNIFSKIFDFFKLIVTGTAINTAMEWYKDDGNKKKVENFFNFLKENATTILLIIGAIAAIDIAVKLSGLVLAAKALVGVVLSPAFLTVVAVIAAFYGLAKLLEGPGKEIFNADMQNLNLMENQLYDDYVERFKKDLGRDPNPKEKLQLYTDAKVDAQKRFAADKQQTNIKDDGRIDGGINNPYNLFPNTNIGGEGNAGSFFRNGGYTGGKGSKPVGFVHPREFVIKEEAVDKIGLAKLYAMNNGKIDGNVKVTVIKAPTQYIDNPIDANDTNAISATSVLSVSPGDIKNKYNSEILDELNLKSFLA
tara:strand:+ start:1524 stop:2891 length:1368 start_codon:yes stop_codon:yes gene_type:complete